MSLRLQPRNGPDLGARAVIDDDRPRVVGRGPECDLPLNVKGVSRRHARIERRADGFYVTDLGSTNGTYVNRRKVTEPRRLEDGDELVIGQCELLVQLSRTGAFPEPVQFRIQVTGAARTLLVPALRVGRAADCHLVVEGPALSRLEYTVEHDGDGFVLRDQGSANGTFVNARRVVSQVLADGDAISSGPPEEAGAARFRLGIAGLTCTLTAEPPPPTPAPTRAPVTTAAPAADVKSLPEPRAEEPRTRTKAVPVPVAPLTVASRRQEAIEQSRELSRVIMSLEKQKAKYRGGKWVPTSDLLPDRARRIGSAALLAALAVFAVAVLASGRGALFNPGRLASVHSGDAWRETLAARQGGAAAASCRACHLPFRRVADQACASCHADTAVPAPHDPAKLAASGRRPLRCAGCHVEHEGDPSPRPAGEAPRAPHPQRALVVTREVCVGCHDAAHRRSPTPRDTPGQAFLGDFYSSTWVHALHRRQSACADCHENEVARLSGEVTQGCADCHGGGQGPADARCLSCHYLHRGGPLLLRREAEGQATAAPATSRASGERRPRLPDRTLRTPAVPAATIGSSRRPRPPDRPVDFAVGV